MPRRPHPHTLTSQRQDAEAVARAYGDGDGQLVLCESCGAILTSSVVDTEPHRPNCPHLKIVCDV